jgi:hypothetical protein
MEHIIRLNIFNIKQTDENKNKKNKKPVYKNILIDNNMNTLKLNVIIEIKET